MSDLAFGHVIGAYRIERLLGRGGFGAVYLAEDIRLGRKVALKVIAPELADDSRARERFVTESRLAASLDHPNIIPIFEADEAEGHLFLAMRYVPGQDLEGLLAGVGKLPVERTIGVVSQVASALDAAHEAGLIHRDVKPGNILLAPGSRPGSDHVYLADFGLTKQTSLESSDSTRSGSLVGSVGYVAPEQITHQRVDRRADVYSLGCVAFECLSGRPPYPRDSDMASLIAHVEEPAPSLAEDRSELPAEIDLAIGKALSKRPADRFDTAGDFAAALAKAAEPDTSRSPLTRGYLFADLRGYTAFVEANGDAAAVDLLGAYRRIVRDVVTQFGGAEIKTEGDSFYVVFPSASGAVQAGMAIVARAAGATEAEPTRPIRVGVGIHAGESATTAEGYVGSAVNIAARVCGQSVAGEVLVTDTVRSLVRTSLDVGLTSRGRHHLKGIGEPVALYAVAPGRHPTSGVRRLSLGSARSASAQRRRALVVAGAAAAVAAVMLGALALGGFGLGGRPGNSQGAGGSWEPASGAIVAPSAAPLDWLAYEAIDLPTARAEAKANALPVGCTDDNAKVHVVRVDGTGDTRLTNGTDLYESLPQWSPDGSSVLFLGWEQNAGTQVWRVAPSGSGVARVPSETSRRVRVTHPRWSFDGRRIVYEHDGDIVSVLADGSGRTTVSQNPMAQIPPDATPPPDASTFSAPTWIPDGRIGAIKDGEVWAMRDDGADARRVAPGLDLWVEDASWSPDGHRIAFAGHPKGDPPWPTGIDLYAMNADGTGLTQLTNATGDENRPAWSLDGSRIAFDALDGDVPQVFVVDAIGGGPPRRVTQPTETTGACAPSWGRTGGAVIQPAGSPDPSASAQPLVFEVGPLVAGTYVTTTFKPSFELTVPRGWYGFRNYRDGLALRPDGALIPQPAELDVIKAQVAFTSPCDDSPKAALGGKPVDLYEALVKRKEFLVSEPTPVNLTGASGITFTLSVRKSAKPKACRDLYFSSLFLSGQDTYWMYDTDTTEFTVLDVAGETITFFFETESSRFEKSVPLARDIISSFTFRP